MENPRSKKTGLPPGTLVHVGEKKVEFLRTTVMLYHENEIREFDLQTTEELFALDTSGFMVWINIDGIHDDSVIGRIGKHFQLDNLSLEDIMNSESRPKMEEFDQYIFLLVKDIFQASSQALEVDQISFILKENLLITFQEEEGDVFDNVRNRIRQGSTKIRTRGADYLAYALLDSIIDNYYLILEGFEKSLEGLEDELIAKIHQSQLLKIREVKRKFLMLRQIMGPVREVVYALHKTENPIVKKKTHLFIRDLYDHSLQINDHMEQIRETVSEFKDIFMSGSNTIMNNIMKTLTVVSTIFMACSLVAGIYGMNFENMPETKWLNGYYYALGFMGLIAVFLILIFKRKKWL